MQVYSLGLFTGDGCLMGMLVAELQSLTDVEGDFGPLLNKPSPHATVMYILSLGNGNHSYPIINLVYVPWSKG